MIQSETRVFLIMTLCGVLLSAGFDIFRAVRNTLNGGKYVSAVCDIVFWITACFSILAAVWNFNSGIFRFYEPLGIILGAVFYFLLLSKCFFRIFLFIIENILRIVRFILKILLTPPLFLYKISVVPIKTKILAKKRKGHDIYDE